jgi:hypothetical protein
MRATTIADLSSARVLTDDELRAILTPAKLPWDAFITFSDLKRAGLVKSYDGLNRLQAVGFPEGRWLSPNRRVWYPQDVARYLAALPTERPKLPPEMKRRRPPNAERVKPAKRSAKRPAKRGSR